LAGMNFRPLDSNHFYGQLLSGHYAMFLLPFHQTLLGIIHSPLLHYVLTNYQQNYGCIVVGCHDYENITFFSVGVPHVVKARIVNPLEDM
jgi:hypothetical protein